MSERAITAVVSVILAILGLAIVAVLVSQKSNTTGVFSASGGALSQALGCALSPITGGSCGSLIPNVTSTIRFGGITGGG